jgi:hypothetical protein
MTPRRRLATGEPVTDTHHQRGEQTMAYTIPSVAELVADYLGGRLVPEMSPPQFTDYVRRHHPLVTIDDIAVEMDKQAAASAKHRAEVDKADDFIQALAALPNAAANAFMAKAVAEHRRPDVSALTLDERMAQTCASFGLPEPAGIVDLVERYERYLQGDKTAAE